VDAKLVFHYAVVMLLISERSLSWDGCNLVKKRNNPKPNREYLGLSMPASADGAGVL
jgi:hypothetical protein